MTARCSHSDLHADQCAHCTGAQLVLHVPDGWKGTEPRTEPTPAAPTPRRQLTGLPQSAGGKTSSELDIHDLADDLTREHAHREPFVVRRGLTLWASHHVTRVPALIDQLQQATASSTGEGGAGGYASRPAAHLESLDTLMHIDLAAGRWVRDLGEDDHHTDTKATIRQLHALHASAPACPRAHAGRGDCCTAHAIEADVRRWWTQARIVTGWDSPAWRPDNTCPACTKRGTLRVRFAAQAGLCIDCRTTWGPEVIGLLADHIRLENADDGTDDNQVDELDPHDTEQAS